MTYRKKIRNQFYSHKIEENNSITSKLKLFMHFYRFPSIGVDIYTNHISFSYSGMYTTFEKINSTKGLSLYHGRDIHRNVYTRCNTVEFYTYSPKSFNWLINNV